MTLPTTKTQCTGQHNLRVELDLTDPDKLQAQLTQAMQTILSNITTRTNDGRNYLASIDVKMNVTIDPSQAEISEHTHFNHLWTSFRRKSPHATKHSIEEKVFLKTHHGWKRVE